MSTANDPTAKPARDEKDEEKEPFDPTREPGDLPEEEFWEQYSKRLEFPLATVSTVLIHVLVAALLVLTLTVLMKHEDRSGVPVKLVPEMGGLDDEGSGQAGSGGQNDPLREGKPIEAAQADALPSPIDLNNIKQDLRKSIIDDASGDTPIADANAKAYSELDKALLDKLMNPGARKGEGPGKGTGADGSAGAGPGGVGASSSRARSLRWVMKFRTNNDYVAQLAALGAELLIPLPDGRTCLYFSDLKDPKSRRQISLDEVGRIAKNRLQFGDSRPSSVREVCDALGVTEPAKSVWAFFPKGLEEQLAQKEIGYRNRRPDDIEETKFRVIVRGGSYDIVVDDQTAKR
jgi:hypothetical protein